MKLWKTPALYDYLTSVLIVDYTVTNKIIEHLAICWPLVRKWNIVITDSSGRSRLDLWQEDIEESLFKYVRGNSSNV